MTQAPNRRAKRIPRKGAIGCLVRQVQVALLCVLALSAGLVVMTVARHGPWSQTSATPSEALAAPMLTPSSTPASPSPTPSPRPAATTVTALPTQPPLRIGILIGHSGPEDDPGAVCPDGRREVDINGEVGQMVIAALRRKGYQVDQLNEWDDRLDGYAADAFLSIHSDSCEVAEASGFKVARASASAIPEIEDRLVRCLETEYALASGLGIHSDSITPDMFEYHAFLQVAPETPSAIIELGFMLADRKVLDTKTERLAAGIVASLDCFLEQKP
jgi:N-acetylmuramoyl-L-alanine amidase